VINLGQVLMTGPPDAVRADRQVQEVYTGSGVPAVTARVAGSGVEVPPLLRLDDVDTFYGGTQPAPA
jgi:hypothetical protein